MFLRRIAVGAAALALPLALTATPASATAYSGHDDEASIEIVDLTIVNRHKAEVGVEFECDGHAKIKVAVWQDGAKYKGDAWVDCDDEEADVTVYRESHKKLEKGEDAHVAAYLKERGRHGDSAEDHEKVEVEGRGGHGH